MRPLESSEVLAGCGEISRLTMFLWSASAAATKHSIQPEIAAWKMWLWPLAISIWRSPQWRIIFLYSIERARAMMQLSTAVAWRRGPSSPSTSLCRRTDSRWLGQPALRASYNPRVGIISQARLIRLCSVRQFRCSGQVAVKLWPRPLARMLGRAKGRSITDGHLLLLGNGDSSRSDHECRANYNHSHRNSPRLRIPKMLGVTLRQFYISASEY